MAKVIYTGPYDEVEVPLPSGETAHAVNGEPVDVPAEIAEGLLLQTDIWSEPATPKQTTKEAK